MVKLYKQFVGLVTKLKASFKADEFLTARLKLTSFYSLTAIVILGGSSLVLYKTLLSNLTDSINESVVDPTVANAILDKTRDILQNRFILVDSIIVFFVIIIGFLLTQKTLEPIKNNMQKQKRFIADASHELRTPIAIAISGIEVTLRNKNLNPTLAKETLENTLIEMREISKLSINLLDISKYDTNKKIEHKEVIINDLVKSVSLKMDKIAFYKEVTIKTNIVVPTSIQGNRIELGRVFYNIINNAITYTPKGGIITISDKVLSDKYVVTITDTGIGIKDDILDRIFDPFFRSDISRNSEGAGLGLTISKKIIENHNGTIHINSKINNGTSVIISLPITTL